VAISKVGVPCRSLERTPPLVVRYTVRLTRIDVVVGDMDGTGGMLL
jgi:hypothetical protein